MIAQYAPDGQRQAWYTQSLARIDEVLSVANESGKFWTQADALGSVYGLTNQGGALVGNQNYDVFGAPTPAPSGPAGQPFGFTGREHELDSGLVYARARYLDPSLGRWTQADPAKFVDGINRFVYAHSRPTALRDPMGLFAGLPLVPLLLTDIAFTLGLDVGMLLSFGFPGVVIVVGGVVAAAAAVAILVSLVMLIDAVRADFALRVSQDSYSPARTRCIDDSAASSVQMVPIGTFEYTDEVEDNADFEQFTADIRRNGILVPVRYVRSGGRNWLVDGNHRVKAALRAGETQIPAEEVSLPYGRFQNEADLRDYFWKRFMDSENR